MSLPLLSRCAGTSLLSVVPNQPTTLPLLWSSVVPQSTSSSCRVARVLFRSPPKKSRHFDTASTQFSPPGRYPGLVLDGGVIRMAMALCIVSYKRLPLGKYSLRVLGVISQIKIW
jgi:hypothetical protein